MSGGPSLAASVLQHDQEKRRLACAAVHRHARFGATLVQRSAQGVNIGRSKVTAAPAAPRNVARNAKHHVRQPSPSQLYATLLMHRSTASDVLCSCLPSHHGIIMA